MGSFNGVCHLSGMGISENESVLFIPTQYSYISDLTTQAYSTSEAAHICDSPIETSYNGYGSINSINEDWITDILLKNINRGLINNKNQEHKSFFGKKYGFLKRDNFPNQFSNLRFLTDSAIFNKLKNRENLHDIQKLENNDALIDTLSENNLFSISGDKIYRYGYILIKKSFFNKMLDANYKDKMNRIFKNIVKHIKDPVIDDQIINGALFHGQTINKDYFQNNVLELFNDNNTLSYEQYGFIKKTREFYQLKKYENEEVFNKKLNEITYRISQQAIISKMYADIGKTFYPNAAPLRDHKALYNYANILKEELEVLNQTNLDSYSVENGYDEETQKRYQWQTPVRF